MRKKYLNTFWTCREWWIFIILGNFKISKYHCFMISRLCQFLRGSDFFFFTAVLSSRIDKFNRNWGQTSPCHNCQRVSFSPFVLWRNRIVIVPRSEIVFSDRTVKVKRALSLSQLQKRRRLLSLYQLEESAILDRTVTVPITNGVLETKSPW